MIITGTQRHSFICTDSWTGFIYRVDKDGNITESTKTVGACFDLWELPDGKLLYPHYFSGTDGVSIFDRDSNLTYRYETTGEIFSCQPLDNGNILVGELIPKRLTEVSPSGEIVKEIPIKYDEENAHECMRMVRKTKDSYFIVQPGLKEILKLDLDGKEVFRYKTEHDTFGVVQKPDGNIVYTYMDGIVELDTNGNEVWHLRDGDLPGINLCWALGIQLLKNGNLVITNWLGHGHNGEGIMFFELDKDLNVVWTCDAREEMINPACLQILDEDGAEVCYTPMK